ncbi:arsenic resistance N-acetyltransferase ArsN2 [Pseudomonas sp. MBLB4123]|uniref:arsenic resistance N-acetyltransferase ArsN2 n=1 Tax=Pseudomonas sp. MBLB4123 TaxID=3451557 RepID=UPI003F751ACD
MQPSITPMTEADELLPLLRACDLPVADVAPGPLQQFFSLRDESGLLGVVGLELLDTEGLLRSLAIAPAHRGKGLAAHLVAFAEARACAQGIGRLFLLTTTAADYFTRLGYQPTEKAAAPPAIQATAQFAGLCPAASSLLCKSLDGRLRS